MGWQRYEEEKGKETFLPQIVGRKLSLWETGIASESFWLFNLWSGRSKVAAFFFFFFIFFFFFFYTLKRIRFALHIYSSFAVHPFQGILKSMLWFIFFTFPSCTGVIMARMHTHSHLPFIHIPFSLRLHISPVFFQTFHHYYSNYFGIYISSKPSYSLYIQVQNYYILALCIFWYITTLLSFFYHHYNLNFFIVTLIYTSLLYKPRPLFYLRIPKTLTSNLVRGSRINHLYFYWFCRKIFNTSYMSYWIGRTLAIIVRRIEAYLLS